MTPAEWKELLNNRIPKLVAASEAHRDSECHKVLRWYEACLDSLNGQDAGVSVADVLLLCRKDDAWNYITGHARWLADDTELSEAFRSETWQITFPERLHSEAKRYFGLSALSDAKLQPRWDSTTGQDEPKLQMKLDAVKPYVFVWRCYKTKQDHQQLRRLLNGWRVRVAKKLDVVASLGHSLSTKVVEKRVALAGEVLLLNEDHADLPLLADAIAEAVGTPSETDFYENLLRCESDADRVRKLEARNYPAEQIQRLLLEYNASPTAETAEQVYPTAGKNAPSMTTKTTSDTLSKDTESIMAAPLDEGQSVKESQVGGAPTEKTQTPKSANDPPLKEKLTEQERSVSNIKEPGTAARTLSLKEPNQPVRLLRSHQRTGSSTSRDQRTSADPDTGNDTRDSGETRTASMENLSYEQKKQIEKRGREFAARVLSEEMGYHVRQMPDNNPGFDLEARKDKEILRIEIKAHLRTASVIDLTISEHREYARWKNAGLEYRWELWNVEHVAKESEETATITRFCDIPDDAIDAKLLRVDLRLCT
jgi:hypothetical protein